MKTLILSGAQQQQKKGVIIALFNYEYKRKTEDLKIITKSDSRIDM